jgi:hypothetical protein
MDKYTLLRKKQQRERRKKEKKRKNESTRTTNHSLCVCVFWKKRKKVRRHANARKKIRRRTVYSYVRVSLLQKNEQDVKRRKKTGGSNDAPLRPLKHTYTMNESRTFISFLFSCYFPLLLLLVEDSIISLSVYSVSR